MTMMPVLLMFAGLLGCLVLGALALSGPSQNRAQARRIGAVKLRHAGGAAVVEAQMRRVLQQRERRLDKHFSRIMPKPAEMVRKLEATGRSWTIGQYAMASLGLTALVLVALLVKGLPVLLALFIAMFVGLGLPYKVVNTLIARRVKKFTTTFPDAIELLVRGLRSGLPVSETMGVVATEVPGPLGVEFRSVVDKMRIGKTMESALQETADRMGTPEIQFFVITLAIQRETGGNLAETLSNLADVLRKRAQMKLKIKAMASESKASAMILGALPFIVFVLIYFVNASYMAKFFTDTRLMIAGGGGMVWMSLGAYIMAQMINFEI